MEERNIFYPFPEYERIYEVNKSGIVRSIDRIVDIERGNQRYSILRKGGVVKIQKSIGYGYLAVELRKNGERKTWFLHRILALTFIKNPENKKCVNHKNGIKTDNRIENLEWVTHSENFQHAVETGLIKKPFRPLNHKKGKDHPYFGKTGEMSHNSKIIFDTQTGIFYFGVKEAAEAKDVNLNCLRRKLFGGRRNNTSLIYV